MMLEALTNLFVNDFVLLMFGLLPLLMVIDIITAWVAAAINGRVSSKANSKGYLKKALMLVVMVAFVGADVAINVGLVHFGVETFTFGGIKFHQLPMFTVMVLLWQVVGELISILENLDKGGVRLPSWILRILDATRERLDNYDKRA